MANPNITYAARTVEYFAQVIDTPWIVEQERLDELRQYTNADENVDFNLASHLDSEGEVANIGRLYSLPFRLSFGLHVAVSPQIEPELSKTFYTVYRNTEPLEPVKSTLKTNLAMQKAERARRAIVGAIIGAASDGIPMDRVRECLEFSKKEKLLNRVDAFGIKDTIKLLKAT